MDPITQKIISLTQTPGAATVSDLFETYAWIGSSSANSSSGIHTSAGTVDMTKGGMVMGKRGDQSSDWYVADTLVSPLDGSQGTPGQGSVEWTGHPSDAPNDTAWTVPAGVSTFTFSNVPANKAYAFTLELTHTSGSANWPATVKWPNDSAPSLTAGKTHLFMFVTDDSGSRWRGSSLVNYTN